MLMVPISISLRRAVIFPQSPDKIVS